MNLFFLCVTFFLFSGCTGNTFPDLNSVPPRPVAEASVFQNNEKETLCAPAVLEHLENQRQSIKKKEQQVREQTFSSPSDQKATQ